MLKKFKRFISNCSDFVNVYSKRIDEISKEVNSLSNEYRDVESNIKDDLLKIDEKIVNLDYKITSLLSSLDCVNLEYLNLDNCVSKNKVLIVGFYGAPNLGDELMLLTLLNKLSSFDNILDITVMMFENYNFDITGYPKCKIIHYPKNIIDINTFLLYVIHRHYKNKIDYLYKNCGYKNYKVNYSSANSESFINTFDELCKSQ